MLKIVAACLLVLLCHQGNSLHTNNKPTPSLSVTLAITGNGAPAVCIRADTSDYYFVTATVFNNEDTTVALFINSCSWPMEAFVVQNDSIRFEFCFSGCDHNVPEKISVPGKKSAQFYGTIKSWKKDPAIARIKLGFKHFRTVNDLWFSDESSRNKRQYTMYWSNEVELKDNLYSYEIK